MARQRMVTRTINVITINVLCMDCITCEVSTQTYTMTGDVLTEDEAMKKLKKEHETENFKLVKVLNTFVEEKLYGISEVDFLKYAKELPPRWSASHEVAE